MKRSALVLATLGLFGSTTANAALRANAQLATTAGVTRLVVTVTGVATVPAQERPAGATVDVGRATFRLSKFGTTWRSSALGKPGIAALGGNVGKRIIVRVRSRSGTRTLHPRLRRVGTSAGQPTGAWFYNGNGTGVRFDLATRAETEVSLSPKSQEAVGYGADMFTDVDEVVHISASPNEYSINLRSVTPNAFSIKRTLPTLVFSKTNGRISGRVQPSPDGALFAMHSRESTGLGDPFLDYVYVLDASLNVKMKQQGYRDPIWLGPDRLLVAGDDGLFSLTVAASPTTQRIGPVGLAQPGTQPLRPSLSPDARSVAFVQGDIIWRIGVDGTGIAQLTQASIDATWPTWSPDGSKLTVIDGRCGPVGTGVIGGTDVVIISATAQRQDIGEGTRILRRNGAPVRTCGPVYWLP